MRRIGLMGLMMASLLMAGNTWAQSNTNAPPLPGDNPITVITQWMTSSDTNSTLFDLGSLTVWAGNSYVNNANNASTFGMDLRLYHSLSNGVQFTVESETLNAGVIGVIYSQQGGFQLSKSTHDLRFGAYVDGGYSFVYSRPFLETGIDLRKAMSRISFVYTRLGYDFMQRKAAGKFEAGVGVVF